MHSSKVAIANCPVPKWHVSAGGSDCGLRRLGSEDARAGGTRVASLTRQPNRRGCLASMAAAGGGAADLAPKEASLFKNVVVRLLFALPAAARRQES
jgi:hypothetical protein